MMMNLCCQLPPTDAFLSRKMQEMRFRPGLCLDLAEGAYSTPRPPSWIKVAYFQGKRRGPTFQGREGKPTSKGMGRNERGKKRERPLAAARSSLEKIWEKNSRTKPWIRSRWRFGCRLAWARGTVCQRGASISRQQEIPNTLWTTDASSRRAPAGMSPLPGGR